MELNETLSTDVTEPVSEATEPAYSLSVAETEPQVLEIVVVDYDRSFFSTEFMDYSVSEGLLLLIFVVVFLQFFLGLVRR